MTDSKDRTKSSKTALETAYSYLANRMRTVRETEKHLADRGFSPDEIGETIDELNDLRYLDDYQYALRYYEHNREKRRGSLRAARELAEKGVDQETIRNAREDFLFAGKVDEFEDALEAARRELLLKSSGPVSDDAIPPADDKAAARIARMLENRGFARDIIFRVLDRIRRQDD